MEWLKSRLVPECRAWWKLSSVWLAGVASALATVVIANQGLALSLLGYLPTGSLRTVVALVIGFAVFIVPVLTRLWQQKPPNG